MKILITGISGFLGSAIAENLLKNGELVCGIIRSNSDLWRCKGFADQLKLINIENENWEANCILFEPDLIIHSAWNGVTSNKRNDWNTQLSNLNLSIKLLHIAKTCNVDKFISFGSQAEYGLFDGEVDESYKINPNSAYGLSKKYLQETIECYCNQNGIKWYWLRLFSFFGEKEANTWLIPLLIKNVIEEKEMKMTPGDQKYAYMYIDDLAMIISKIAKSSNIKSGIYNISSNNLISLKELANLIINCINPETNNILFGALPYRENQPMLIKGNIEKLEGQIGKLKESDFKKNLNQVINFYLKNVK